LAQERRWGVAGRRGAVAGLRRGGAVPDDAARDALLDELQPPLGDAFEVERLRQAARVERVVGDRDLRVEDAVADPAAEVAALLEQALGAERVVREVLEQLRERVGLEHGTVLPGLDLPRVERPARLLVRLAAAGARVDRRRRPR